jgi:ubiquinone/menaquinone biosynthesis C-methylase UbiE
MEQRGYCRRAAHARVEDAMPRAAQFSPGVIDYDGQMSASYHSGRALSTESARTWCETAAPFVRAAQCSRVLDLNSGTGRFSALFARSFEAQVIGIEPSKGMLAAATLQEGGGKLVYVAGAAESIPLRNHSCGLAWLSQVWHHVRDRQACVRELRRVLTHGSKVLVRGTFSDKLDGFPTLFRYWPATQGICRQLPTIRETVLVFEANGFVLMEHRRVQQKTCGSLREFAERTQLRADSALTLISDSEFQEGQSALERAAAHEDKPSPVMEIIELLVFQGAA